MEKTSMGFKVGDTVVFREFKNNKYNEETFVIAEVLGDFVLNLRTGVWLSEKSIAPYYPPITDMQYILATDIHQTKENSETEELDKRLDSLKKQIKTYEKHIKKYDYMIYCC